MNIIVLMKRVPQTAEAEVRVDSSGKKIDREHLTFDTNEFDTYALEEAVLFKEKYGGTITALSVGQPDSQDTLRVALAKGADNAIRVKAEDFGDLDAYKTAQLLHAAIKDIPYDIIFAGTMASDDSCYQVGVVLAKLLGIPHATLVSKIEAEGDRADIHKEVEGGLQEHLEITLPAMVAVQTGINVPRYASLIAIRKAAKKEIQTLGGDGVNEGDLRANTQVEELFIPPVTKRAEILEGNVEEISVKMATIFKEKGLI
ncbi:MAG: electron transfer flavoprotein subunit beta/FixA family protein [bacterium]